MKAANVLETIGNTPLIRINRLFGWKWGPMRSALFWRLRRFVARYLIQPSLNIKDGS